MVQEKAEEENIMRLLVCGSRKYNNREKVKRIIEQLAPSVIICGDATGVDMLALNIACELEIEYDGPYIADWNRFGKSAGAIRNKQMLKEGKPDVVAAIYDDTQCRGTKLMVRLAKDAGVPVLDFFMKGDHDN